MTMKGDVSWGEIGRRYVSFLTEIVQLTCILKYHTKFLQLF